MSDKASKLAGVVAALGLTGCNNDDPCEGLRTFDAPPEPTATATAPPIVLSGEWIGTGVLELQFSEPLAVGSAPDPNRFALINWSAEVGEGYSYNYGYGSGSATCNVSTNYAAFGIAGGSYYYSQSGPSIMDVWIAPEDPSLLRVRTASAAPTCRTNTDIVADGLMLVYVDGADAGANPLVDAAGDLVRDLGPSWAIQPWEDCATNFYTSIYEYNYFYCSFGLSNNATGHLPSVTSLAPIPCPG